MNKLIKLYSTKIWDWQVLSSNKFINIKTVEDNIHRNWDYKLLSKNPSIGLQGLLKFPKKSWDYDYFSSLQDPMLVDVVLKFPDKPWNWEKLSDNPTVISIVSKLENKPWNWKLLSAHCTEELFNLYKTKWDTDIISANLQINLDLLTSGPEIIIQRSDVTAAIFIEKFIHKYPEWIPKVSKQLSEMVTIAQVINEPFFKWNWDILSERKDLDIEQVIKLNYMQKWNWKLITRNQGLKTIMKYKNFDWDYDYLSDHNDLTIIMLMDNCNKGWNWEKLSRKYSLQDILKTESESKEPHPWDWNYLSGSEELTQELLEKFIKFPWDWKILSTSNLMTFEFIEKYVNYVSFADLSSNSFILGTEEIEPEPESEPVVTNSEIIESCAEVCDDLVSVILNKPKPVLNGADFFK